MKKIFLTKEQLKAAEDLAAQLRAEAQPDLTEAENLARSIQMRLENVDAAETVQAFNKGIERFHNLFAWASSRSLSAVVAAELDGALSGKTEEEQRKLLTSILAGFAEVTGNALPEGDYDLKILREAVEIYLCEYSAVHLLDPEALPENMSPETAERLLEVYEQASLEQYTATAIYLLQVTGEVEQIPADLTPAQIGTMAAASLKANKSILSHFLGKINSEEFKRTMKLIAGVAALGLMGAVAWSAVKVAYTLAAMGAGALLAKAGISSGFFVKLAGMTAGREVMSGVQDYAKSIAQKTGVSAAAASAWQGIRSYYTEKLVPSLSSFWSNLRTRLGVTQKQAVSVEAPAEEVADTWVDEELEIF